MPYHEVRARFLGNIATSELSASPMSVVKGLWGGELPKFQHPLELIADFKLDHKIPLSLGGAPSDPRNLQLEDEEESDKKDGVEKCLSHLVCAESIRLGRSEVSWDYIALRLPDDGTNALPLLRHIVLNDDNREISCAMHSENQTLPPGNANGSRSKS